MAEGGAVLLVNPAAGSRRRADPAAAFRARFPGARILTTPPPGSVRGELDAALAALDADRDLLVVAGGDGTLRLALDGLARAFGTDRPWPRLAHLPCGSANDGARALAALTGRPHRPGDDGAALAAVATAFRRGAPGCAADVGTVVFASGSVACFANFAAAGSPADWAALAASRPIAALKRLHTGLAYQLCNLLVIARNRSRPVTVSVAGGPPVTAPLFAWFAANARYLGGGMDLGDGARLDSGSLALLAVPRGSRRSLLRLLAAVKKGAGPPPVAATAAALSLEPGAALNLDGELIRPPAAPPGPLTVSVLAGQARWL